VRLLIILTILLPQLCFASVTNFKVVNDRWPDFSTLGNFGNTAATIMGATTDTEKALAMYRFVQQSTAIGTVPYITAYRSAAVNEADLLLNVYMLHECTGFAETLVGVWRYMGYKARMIHPDSGHTQADLFWRIQI